MKRGSFILNLAAGLSLTLLSLVGFALLRHRPDLPAGTERSAIVAVDGQDIRQPDELNFVLGEKSIGDAVSVRLRTAAGVETRSVVLVAHYRQAPYPVIYLLLGLFNMAIVLAVFLRKPSDPAARIFFWCGTSFSYAIIVSGEFYCWSRAPLTWVPGFFYNILYPLAPALLLYFCLALSRKPRPVERWLAFGPPAVLAVLLDSLFLGAVFGHRLAFVRRELVVVYVFRWYLAAAIILSLLVLVRSFRRSESREERAQLMWIFYGLALGLTPFLLLYQLPRILGLPPVLSEDVSSVFYVFIPPAFAVAIVKHKLLRIEVVINRSLVYGALTILIVGLYLFFLESFRLVLGGVLAYHRTVSSLAAAIVLAASFDPARRRIQGFVDRRFFRQSYDARQAVLSFSTLAQRAPDAERLVDIFGSMLARALPVERLDFALYDLARDASRPRIWRGDAAVIDRLGANLVPGGPALARRTAVRFEEDLDFSRDDVLESCQVDLALPLPLHSPNLRGLVALGGKKSGERYGGEDLDFIGALLGELALHLERTRLQEEVIYERATREKLDELNRLKTEFVSSVSHELRTPLSSLQGLVEILQSGKLKDEAGREGVLEIMSSESRRLARLLHNILDHGRIEQGVKAYDLKPAALQPLIESVVRLFRMGGEAKDFVLTVDLPARPVIVRFDRDAVEQALINLIDNAMKYSGDRKEVVVRLSEGPASVEIQVRDWGIGLPAAERDRVFEGFYRTAEGGRHNLQGVGLGLKIVKHIMIAHGGSVRVEPAPDRGTIFYLVFPKP